MYRAMTFAAQQRGIPEGDFAEKVAAMAAELVRIEIDDDAYSSTTSTPAAVRGSGVTEAGA